jgi:hypothetical protein
MSSIFIASEIHKETFKISGTFVHTWITLAHDGAHQGAFTDIYVQHAESSEKKSVVTS